MTQEEKRIAIAKACGWKWEQDKETLLIIVTPPVGAQSKRKVVMFIEEAIPNYLHDLNAMHEVEKALPDGNADGSYNHYAEHLDEVTEALTYDRGGWATHHWRRSYSATAAQRAEAFGLTLELWEAE